MDHATRNLTAVGRPGTSSDRFCTQSQRLKERQRPEKWRLDAKTITVRNPDLVAAEGAAVLRDALGQNEGADAGEQVRR
jgi:hypothetical protein